MPRQYGIDVSAYQYSNLSRYINAGAKYVFVKLTEGTGYFSPAAYAQIRSAHHHHIYVHAYHFATFGHSARQAKAEARHFLARARYLNISKKRYLALDWETGDGNQVYGSTYANTRAIIAFMSMVKKAGYKPMLYSGASLLLNNINVGKVVRKFGTCIWAAKYASMGRIDTPSFSIFPSMPGVAIWQFSSNWHGLNVDGNISLVDLQKSKAKAKHAENVQKKPKNVQKHAENVQIVYAPIIDNNLDYLISLRDSNGHATGKFIPTNSRWRVFGEKMIRGRKYYKLGTDKQWVPAKYLRVIK